VAVEVGELGRLVVDQQEDAVSGVTSASSPVFVLMAVLLFGGVVAFRR
jgi:hypothetical protein